jgi:hypothetical protein
VESLTLETVILMQTFTLADRDLQSRWLSLVLLSARTETFETSQADEDRHFWTSSSLIPLSASVSEARRPRSEHSKSSRGEGKGLCMLSSKVSAY